jgi:hypothetical protein
MFKVNENVVVSDVDGVLLDFDRSFAAVCESALGRPVPKVSVAYSLAQRYGLTRPEMDRVWSAMDDHPEGWCNLRLLPGATEAIGRLQRHGFSIRLVTGILPDMAEKRLANLLTHGIEVDAIDCVGIGSASKREPLLRHAPFMFFDDRLHLLHECDFVPNRVWLDHGDDQGGLVPHESLHRTDNLLDWVRTWEHVQGIDLPWSPAQPRSRRLSP